MRQDKKSSLSIPLVEDAEIGTHTGYLLREKLVVASCLLSLYLPRVDTLGNKYSAPPGQDKIKERNLCHLTGNYSVKEV
jgi:hypothetical protein